MTITLQFGDQEQIEELKEYFKEVYDFIDLEKEHIPASMSIIDNTITIYMTEKFFRYTYQFFLDKLILNTTIPGVKEDMEKMSKEFRQGAEELLMSNVVL